MCLNRIKQNKNMTRTIILCALLAGTSLPLLAQRNNNEVLIEKRSMANAAIQRVDADADAGNISIEGVSSADVRVEVYAWSNDNEKDTKERFSQVYDVSIANNNGTLTVRTKRKSRQRDNDVSVSIRLLVPASASSELSSSGGNLSFAKLAGSQKAKTKGGNIAFDEIKGTVSGNTSGGNISIMDCSEIVDVKTS